MAGSTAVYPLDRTWELHDAIALACTLEATAPKAGNVHPSAPFGDMHFAHFAASAAVLARVLSHRPPASVGRAVREAVDALSDRVGVNTSLGTILLMAPIAIAWNAAGRGGEAELRRAVSGTLQQLTPSDASCVYEAIRSVSPGGLGRSNEDDVHGPPPDDLVAAMARAAPWDAVARQFATGMADIFDVWLPVLADAARATTDALAAVCWLQIHMLADQPDGLIHRKCGASTAMEIQRQARTVRDVWYGPGASPPGCVSDVLACPSFRALDASLRTPENRKNPGTTADMIATTLLIRLLVGP